MGVDFYLNPPESRTFPAAPTNFRKVSNARIVYAGIEIAHDCLTYLIHFEGPTSPNGFGGYKIDNVRGHHLKKLMEVVGVERWDQSSVVVRGRFRVAPLEQWNYVASTCTA